MYNNIKTARLHTKNVAEGSAIVRMKFTAVIRMLIVVHRIVDMPYLREIHNRHIAHSSTYVHL